MQERGEDGKELASPLLSLPPRRVEGSMQEADLRAFPPRTPHFQTPPHPFTNSPTGTGPERARAGTDVSPDRPLSHCQTCSCPLQSARHPLRFRLHGASRPMTPAPSCVSLAGGVQDELEDGGRSVSASVLGPRSMVTQAWRSSLTNRYLLANLLYVVYSAGMLLIDYYAFDNHGRTAGDAKVMKDRLYVGFGVVHLVNACMYVWSWEDRGWCDLVVIPEYLNIAEALIYLASAAFYPYQDTDGYEDAYTRLIHRLETAASLVELVAAVGWVYAWYATYVRVPGRGWTLDDPDVWACLTIIPGALLYVVYNLQILHDPSLYASYALYVQADWLYFVNSLLYTAAALRDDGWFWFMPLAGQWRDTKSTETAHGMPPDYLLHEILRRMSLPPQHKARVEETKGECDFPHVVERVMSEACLSPPPFTSPRSFTSPRLSYNHSNHDSSRSLPV